MPTAPPGPNSYTTLAAGQDFRNEIAIRRSRFITVLRRVEDETGARALVAELRREFYGARHHCSAFVLGPGRSVRRSNDDGEPSGTAGAPMLDALLKHGSGAGTVPSADLSDVCAVVVRYFGGILLGAGGLVRAYSESVGTALELAPLVRRNRLQLFTVSVPHADAGRVENELRTAGCVMTGNSYGAERTDVGLAIADDAAVIAAVQDRLASLSAGHSTLVPVGVDWVDAAS
ncbi:YigZ family protein [Arthrobacter livingstonensis]|uniref:YigZ family protein n=1 Tax=Arthrobacter livingstonensis TaxID=670078 RepID=A0A2V5L2I4_9MICC|nr:YigZ family protein [Arthrobacter livingstonensis]